jgi:hypothetical protein
MDCAQNFDDCANTPNDLMNVVVDLVDMPNISYVDFYIPNPTLLQLLLFSGSKIKTMFTAGFVICFLSSSFFMFGFYI